MISVAWFERFAMLQTFENRSQFGHVFAAPLRQLRVSLELFRNDNFERHPAQQLPANFFRA